jgi:hypothetical protein
MWGTCYSCQVLGKLNFSRQIFNIYSDIKYLLDSVQWEPSSSMRTNGRADMTKPIVAFRNFANAPKIYIFSVYITCFSTQPQFIDAVDVNLN